MCLGEIKKLFKGNNKEVYGYKIATRHGTKFGPIYQRQVEERWTQGVWATASDDRCSVIPLAGIRSWLKAGGRKWNDKFRDKKLICIWSGWADPEIYYEPGYHYFDTLQQAVYAWSDFGDSGARIIYCAFKEVVATGSQWGSPCRVAKKMMWMDELTITEARREVRGGK